MRKLIIVLSALISVLCLRAQTNYSQSLVNKAKSGDANSQYDLAQCYFYGHGVASDLDLAIDYYKQAGENGNVDGVFKAAALGFIKAYAGNDMAQARAYMDQLIDLKDSGYIRSTFLLAKIYTNLLDFDNPYLLKRLKEQDLPPYILQEVKQMYDAEKQITVTEQTNTNYTAQKALQWLGLDGDYSKSIDGDYMLHVAKNQLLCPSFRPEDIVSSIQYTDIVIVSDDIDLIEDDRQIGSMCVDDDVMDLTKSVVKADVYVPRQAEESPKPDDIIYNTSNVVEPPCFPGGEAAMYDWISRNINYPTEALEQGVSGRVTLELIIDKTGGIESVKVVRGRHPALDKEAIRLIKSMPKWKPAYYSPEVRVKCTYIVPVTFKLPE